MNDNDLQNRAKDISEVVDDLMSKIESLEESLDDMDNELSNRNQELCDVEEANNDLEIDLSEARLNAKLLNNRVLELEIENSRLQVLYDEQDMKLSNES